MRGEIHYGDFLKRMIKLVSFSWIHSQFLHEFHTKSLLPRRVCLISTRTYLHIYVASILGQIIVCVSVYPFLGQTPWVFLNILLFCIFIDIKNNILKKVLYFTRIHIHIFENENIFLLKYGSENRNR